MKSSVLTSNACEAVVATAVAECEDCRHVGLENLKPPSELVSKRPHSNGAGMVQLCLKSGPAFSPKNFCLSVGAHRLQTEFLCLLSWLWLQGLSTQYS